MTLLDDTLKHWCCNGYAMWSEFIELLPAIILTTVFFKMLAAELGIISGIPVTSSSFYLICPFLLHLCVLSYNQQLHIFWPLNIFTWLFLFGLGKIQTHWCVCVCVCMCVCVCVCVCSRAKFQVIPPRGAWGGNANMTGWRSFSDHCSFVLILSVAKWKAVFKTLQWFC